MQSNEPEELSVILERGIATYIDAEPATSLERRVLARAFAAEAKSPSVGWRWAIAAVLVVVSLVGGVVWRHRSASRGLFGSRLEVRAGSSHAPDFGATNQEIVQSNLDELPVDGKAGHGRSATKPIMPGPVRASIHTGSLSSQHHWEPRPKLDQFPSSTPLTEEERELVAFTEHYPDAARELVEAQQRSDEPIQIAAIHIEPLNVGEAQPQGDENEK